MKLIITLLSGLTLVSCQQQIITSNPIVKQDAIVTFSAVSVEELIRSGKIELDSAKTASNIIKLLLEDSEFTRAQLEQNMREALSLVFAPAIVERTVTEVMNVYDKSMESLHGNEDLMIALKATKAVIDSGILLSMSDARPAMVVPYDRILKSTK